MRDRLKNEIEHSKHLAASGAVSIWNWDSPAGRRRWARRAAWLCRELKLGQKVLELGCGTGLLTRELVKTGATVTAIDISPELLEIARQGLSPDRFEFKIEDACHTSFAAGTFDVVLGSSVLHHLDLAAALGEAYRVLAPGGLLRFAEPNMMNPQIAVQKNVPWIKKRMGDSPDETAFFRWSLAKRLKAAGFADLSLAPFDFLHPAIPASMLDGVESALASLERVPLLKEIAGSLMIQARKPLS